MRTAVLEFDDSTTVSLESQLQRLALEAGFLSNVAGVFKNVVPSVSNAMKEAYQLFVSSDQITDQIKETQKNISKLKPRLKHASLVSLDKTLVSVPEGFKGNFLDYAETLLSMSDEVFQESNKLIGEYSFVLSAFITNREDKISLQDHSNLFIRIQKRREELIAKISKFFPTTGDLSKAYIGTVIERVADVEVLVSHVEKLNGKRKQQSLEDLRDSIKKCTDLLDIIVEDVRREGVQQISGPAAMKISQGAYEVARYVEFISSYRFKTEQFIVAVGKLVTQLDQLL